MASTNPNNLDVFDGGEPLPFLKGRTDQRQLELYVGEEPLRALIVANNTYYGATASTWTLTSTTAGVATHFATTASTWTFNATTAGIRTRLGSTASTWTFTATTAGVATHFAVTTSPYVFTATTAGSGSRDTIALVPGLTRQPLRQPEGKPLFLDIEPARVAVYAIQPRLTIGLIITSPSLRAKAHSPYPQLTIEATTAHVKTFYRAERDPSSLDLDREIAVLLEA